MKRAFLTLCIAAIGCGSALQFPAAAIAKGKETVLFKFDRQDGFLPRGGLIDVNGTLYGTTGFGGAGAHCVQVYACGVVFSVDAETGSQKVLYSFCNEKDCKDGQDPLASLIDVDGVLYGSTSAGGRVICSKQLQLRCGTVFSIDPGTGKETLVYSFGGNGTDGAYPEAALINVNGVLYGATDGGGANCTGHNFGGCGTVFSLDPSTGRETMLYSFCSRKNCADGDGPWGGLTEMNGVLYGVTSSGGANYKECNGYGCGAIFSFDPSTGAETVLYSFCSQKNCVDGAGSEASLALINVNGVLYGTTTGGGAAGDGVVFSFDIASGVEKVVYSFCTHPVQHQCRDGESPVAGLAYMKGVLYGATPQGGVYQHHFPGNGVLFALDPNTGVETVLDAFQNSKEGTNPETNVIVAKGVLYGVTAGGGDHDNGTVFAFRP